MHIILHVLHGKVQEFVTSKDHMNHQAYFISSIKYLVLKQHLKSKQD